MKAGTQSSRRSDRETVQLKLADIYKTSVITDKTAEDVQKHRKEMAYHRHDHLRSKQGIIQQFYVIGTADGVGHDGTRDGMDSVEIIGTTRSIHGVYMGIQLIEYCERVR
eukprot:scaffold128183_cov23-Cyclotella_meneghiniana.AAC.1